MPPVKGMTAGERAERNARIAASYCAGESWASLAERAGVSVRHAKRIVVRDRAQRPLSDDPFDRAVALAGLDEFDALMRTIDADRSERERRLQLAEASARLRALTARFDLMAATGALPRLGDGPSQPWRVRNSPRWARSLLG